MGVSRNVQSTCVGFFENTLEAIYRAVKTDASMSVVRFRPGPLSETKKTLRFLSTSNFFIFLFAASYTARALGRSPLRYPNSSVGESSLHERVLWASPHIRYD